MYSNLSPEQWDELYRKGEHWENRPSRQMRSFLMELDSNHGKILDVGCGSGRDSIFLAEQGFSVWGIDLSKEAISKARVKCSAPNLSFSEGDVRHLEFGDKFFDAVYSVWTLNVVSQLHPPASEIHRVLKDGGLAYLVLHLNMKDIDGEVIEHYHSIDAVLNAYSNFEVKSNKIISINDSHANLPHIHNSLVAVFSK